MSEIVEVALFTEAVEAGVAFYRLLLDSEPTAEWTGGATFAAGGATVLIHDRGVDADGEPPNEDHVAVAVTDLDATCERLQVRGIVLLVEPRDFPWGRSAYLRDPDGRLVELTQV
jgi:predicted enzyme related to lactoylglutathione lyase